LRIYLAFPKLSSYSYEKLLRKPGRHGVEGRLLPRVSDCLKDKASQINCQFSIWPKSYQ